MHGRVMHFEVPFDDGERARDFYRDVFGWNLMEMPELNYTIAASGPTSDQGMPEEPGFINGGMMRRDEGPADGPVLVVGVDSIDTALGHVEKLGGSTVLPRQAVSDMGFVAYFKDPEGNLLGMWENAPQS